MKWQLVGLLVLGLVAAGAASLLVGGFQARKRPGSSSGANQQIKIVVAQKNLAATQIVGADDVRLESVRLQEAPKGYLTNPLQVVGKVLTVPLADGQALTKTCFAREGSGLQLAAALPEGMRAVGVQLTDDTGLAGVLYPGCLVDVLVTSQGKSAETTRSQTLFEGVQVLSVQEQTIVNQEGEDTKGMRPQGANKKHLVTLLLDRGQAEQLQAAMKYGSIALALRNPMDKTRAAEARQAEADKAGEAAPSRVWEMTILRAREPEMKKFERRAGVGG